MHATQTPSSAGTVAEQINWELLREILACPACGAAPLARSAAHVSCAACSRTYPIEDGVINFLGRTEEVVPRFYRNPSYRQFMRHLDAMHAAHYDAGSFSARLELAIKEDLFKLVEPGSGPCIDLGCGRGEGFRLIGRDEDIVGVDASLTLLKQAKQLHPKASVLCADLARLPFRNSSLHRVFANAVLEHVFHLESALEQVQRCLGESGRFYVAVPTEGSLAVAVARIVTSIRNGRIVQLTAAESRVAQRIDHCNTVYNLENALRKYFCVEARSYWPFRLPITAFNLSLAMRLRQLPES